MFEDVARDEALVDALVLVGLQVGQSLLRHAFVSGGVCSQAQLVSGWHATERGMERYIGSGSGRGSGTRGRRTYSSPCLQVGLGCTGSGKAKRKRREGSEGVGSRDAMHPTRIGVLRGLLVRAEARGSEIRQPPHVLWRSEDQGAEHRPARRGLRQRRPRPLMTCRTPRVWGRCSTCAP